ncbi:MAG: phosphomannomutase/phosphoglucomutase [Acidobacteria bacterium]|nr:phosphomannomutase/phosphoglucomutase [Acidobacteriota bacterium]MCA1636965.1 phosphomannomutase/phosphoglucomutase [Acidobacteriota bacterium]
MNPNIFREYDIRGIVGQDLTDKTVTILAKAIGTFFVRNNARRIAVGFDARESSPLFRDLLIENFNACGIDVVNIGKVPTPVLYFAVFTKSVDGGVMITGSHNPSDHNGFKICLGKSTLFGSQIQEIREISFSGNFSKGAGKTEKIEVLEDYEQDILSKINLGARKLKVVVDSGNGMGGVTAVPIYQKLGCELIELFTEPDSNFPNHHPDPTVVDNLQDAIKAVKEYNADLAIAFDGDGDRIGVVNEKGKIIWGDELMVLLSREILKQKPNSTIIAEVKCSQNLFDDIAKNSGTALMWKAGHSLIKAKMKETGAVLAGEMSGHIFFADKFYGFDDATYAGARVLEILSNTDKTLSELLADLPETFSTPELRVDCAEEKKFAIVQQIAAEFSLTNEVITIDGARILFENGWGLVRASNTQAILVLRFEADSEENLRKIQETVEARVKKLIVQKY